MAHFESWPKYKIRNSPGVRNTSKPMTFLMQLNCCDVKPLTSCGLFPETGLLSFFVGVEQNQLVLDTNDAPIGRIVYSNSSHFDLERFEFPRNLYYLNQLPPTSMKMEQSVSVSEEILVELVERLNPDSMDPTVDVRTLYHHEIRRRECHKMFGYPTWEELDILEEYSQLVYTTSPQPFHACDWVLLLEFDLGELEIQNSGSLCFFIHQTDLLMMDFKNTICL